MSPVRPAAPVHVRHVGHVGFVVLLVLVVVVSACAGRAPARASATAASPIVAVEPPVADADDEPDDAEAEDDSDGAPTADADGAPSTSTSAGPCPVEMALVDETTPSPRRFCVDRFEASLVEVLADGTEKPYPHYMPVDGHDVRAVSQPGAFPQGYISEVQAQEACAASGKRLCSYDEWKTACMGPSRTAFPYGDARRPGACHDAGKSAVIAVFGAKAVAASTPYAAAPGKTASAKPAHATKRRAAQTTRRAAQTTRRRGKLATNATNATKKSTKPPTTKAARRRAAKRSARPSNVDPGVWARLNDPALGQVEGALARTGDHAECESGFGVFDMVGNLHEWVATDPATVHGTFAGGYYLDTTINGDGCLYRTVAHAHEYHDYSTGFRCCADPAASRP